MQDHADRAGAVWVGSVRALGMRASCRSQEWSSPERGRSPAHASLSDHRSGGGPPSRFGAVPHPIPTVSTSESVAPPPLGGGVQS